jgi:hypothetical protein
VYRAATSDKARLLATLTSPTPPSLAPPRGKASSGYIDVDAMLAAVDPDRTWPRPVPSLMFADLGWSKATAVPLESPARPLPCDARVPSVPIRAASDRVSILGFAAAWLATTGGVAILVAVLMTRGHATATCPVATCSPPTSTPESFATRCPTPVWEPPVVAVGDLPRAASPRAIVYARAPDAGPSPTPAAPSSTRVVAGSHRRGGRGGKTSPPASAPPRSLEDWMRSAVSTP